MFRYANVLLSLLSFLCSAAARLAQRTLPDLLINYLLW